MWHCGNGDQEGALWGNSGGVKNTLFLDLSAGHPVVFVNPLRQELGGTGRRGLEKQGNGVMGEPGEEASVTEMRGGFRLRVKERC